MSKQTRRDFVVSSGASLVAMGIAAGSGDSVASEQTTSRIGTSPDAEDRFRSICDNLYAIVSFREVGGRYLRHVKIGTCELVNEAATLGLKNTRMAAFRHCFQNDAAVVRFAFFDKRSRLPQSSVDVDEVRTYRAGETFVCVMEIGLDYEP